MALVTVLGGGMRLNPTPMEDKLQVGYTKCTKKFSKAKCKKTIKTGISIICHLQPKRDLKKLTRSVGVKYSSNRKRTCKRLSKKLTKRLK